MLSSDECNQTVKDLINCSNKFEKLLRIGSSDEWKVVCRSCSSTGVEKHARAFITNDPRSIILCTNRLSKKSIEEALMHESIHAYDFSVSNIDFGSCNGLAYTEVRAAKAAECAGYLPFDWVKERCIKSKANNSTKIFYPLQHEECVEKVFKAAVADIRPEIAISKSSGVGNQSKPES